MRPLFSKCFTPAVSLALVISIAGADDRKGPADQPAVKNPPTQKPARAEAVAVTQQQLQTWVSQLSSTQYRQRELATIRLLHAGAAAVPALEAGLTEGDLETTSRIVSVLRQLSISFDPQQTARDRAWDSLERIASAGSSSAATRAKLAMDEVRNDRKERAMEALAGAGVFIGFGEYHLASSVVSNDYHLRIPQDWRGNVDALSWLSWLHGVETVILSGDKVSLDVVRHVLKLPDMKNLVIRDTTIAAEDIADLAQLPRLDHFQLVNVPAGDELVDTLSQFHLRRGLTLFGTDITQEGYGRLKEAFPNLDIQCRGGFLGVRCSQLNPICEVGSVEPNTAAAEAGVQPGDVITKFGEFDVENFPDLQEAIAQQTAAEKPIPMVVNRVVEEQVEVELPGGNDDAPQPKLMRNVRQLKTLTLTVKLKREFP